MYGQRLRERKMSLLTLTTECVLYVKSEWCVDAEIVVAIEGVNKSEGITTIGSSTEVMQKIFYEEVQNNCLNLIYAVMHLSAVISHFGQVTYNVAACRSSHPYRDRTVIFEEGGRESDVTTCTLNNSSLVESEESN